MKYERYTKHMTLIILIVQDTRQLQGIIAAEKAGEINQNNKQIQSKSITDILCQVFDP